MQDEYNKVHTDVDGNTWMTNGYGNVVTDDRGNRIPGPAERKVSDGFTYYDSSRGHCGLCGSLMCGGTCFK